MSGIKPAFENWTEISLTKLKVFRPIQSQPKDSGWTEHYLGYEEYTQLMPSLMAPLTRWDFTLEDVMVNRDLVMTTYWLQGERKGRMVGLRGGHLMRIENGEVVEGWGFVNDPDMLDEFFSL